MRAVFRRVPRRLRRATPLLTAAAGALALLALTGGEPPAVVAEPLPAIAAVDPLHRINHIVVIVEQNHTFDSYFGNYPGVNGYDQVDDFPLRPLGTPGQMAPFPYRAEDDALFRPDPGEEPLSNGYPAAVRALNEGRMDGFVRAQYNRGFNGDIAMRAWDRDSIPGLWSLADQYALSDDYYASAMSGSLANMLHLVAGDDFDLIDGTKSALNALSSGVPTVFDQLNGAGVEWGYYIGGLSEEDRALIREDFFLDEELVTPAIMYWVPILAMDRFLDDPANAARVHGQSQFFVDAAKGELPAVTFILPAPTDHQFTPSSVSEARLLGIVNAVMKGPDWDGTAVIVVWDEWGGMYDHQLPPIVNGEQLGFRVPALFISPWAREGYVSSVQRDHTSVLEFIAERFDLPPLSTRQAQANGFEDVFHNSTEPRPARLIELETFPDPPVGSPAATRVTRYMYVGTLLGVGAVVLALVAQPRRRARTHAGEPRA